MGAGELASQVFFTFGTQRSWRGGIKCSCAAKQVPRALHPSRFTTRRRMMQRTGQASWQSQMQPITAAGAAALGMSQVDQRSRRGSGCRAAPHSRHNSMATNMVEIIKWVRCHHWLLTLRSHDSRLTAPATIQMCEYNFVLSTSPSRQERSCH